MCGNANGKIFIADTTGRGEGPMDWVTGRRAEQSGRQDRGGRGTAGGDVGRSSRA